TAGGEDGADHGQHDLTPGTVVDGQVVAVDQGQEGHSDRHDSDDDLGGSAHPGAADLDPDPHASLTTGGVCEPGQQPGQVAGLHPRGDHEGSDHQVARRVVEILAEGDEGVGQSLVFEAADQ